MITHTTPITRFDFFALQDFTAPAVMDAPKVPEPVAIAEEVQTAPPAPPSFSEDDIELAKQTAYAEGLSAGKAQAEQEMQYDGIEATKKLAQFAANLGESMQQAQHNMERQIADQQDVLLHFSKAMAEKLALSALEDNAETVIRDMIAHCLPHIIHQPSLCVTIHPDMKERLTTILAEAVEKAGYKGEHVIEDDEQMDAGDIRLDWERGSAEHSLSTIMAELDALFTKDRKNLPPETAKAAQKVEQLHQTS